MFDSRMPEIWGGFECSVVRIGSTYRNPADETGHTGRLSDIERARELGIRTLRYPALWETISPDDPERSQWRWHDERFDLMRRLGMRPIVGLVHHGSEPLYTDLLDPAFPELLGRHDERVAERYPWIEDWTPVNEPLTTARFSALYGHWYPHRSDTGSFLRATVTQCAATVMAMRAVRRVVPAAKRIQTENIGKTFGTPELAEQARFENERRWLTLNLLCGRVDRHHPWWGILVRHGIAAAELDLFLACDAMPDIIGVNHYLTSERFLDTDWRRYPVAFKGGNGTQDYADVEAVRVALPAKDLGLKARLLEVIHRYRRPVAVTEVHHGCTREEQVPWLAEIWNAATAFKAGGADIRAVTVWSLAGAVDWNSLLVARRGAYEPGAFDVRAPVPRRTALGKAVAELATKGRLTHPALGLGWWRHPERLYHAAGSDTSLRLDIPALALLITGGTLSLARDFAAICDVRGLVRVVVPTPCTPRAWENLLDVHRPWALIDLAGLDAPIGVAEARTLAVAGARRGLPVVVFSSALVFDGRLARPYVESDVPHPDSEAAFVAVETERACLGRNAKALVVRTGPVFSGSTWDSLTNESATVRTFSSQSLVSPTFLPDLAHATLNLLVDGERGLWHLANASHEPWGEVAGKLTAAAGTPGLETLLCPAGAVRRSLALASEKNWIMPSLEQVIARFADNMRGRCAASGQMVAE